MSLEHYDQDERDRVREAVKAYMKTYKIGVPTLLWEVVKADPRHREISLPTLQRFVRGTHHTSDFVIGMCLRFLKSKEFQMPGQQDVAIDPVFALESALSGFFLPRVAVEEETEEVQGIAGRYRRTETDAPDASVEIMPSPKGGALRISETRKQGVTTNHYNGVLLTYKKHLFGVLRNALTYEPRVYWLHYGTGLMPDDDSEMLVGEVRERPFLTAAALVDATDKLTLTKLKAPSL